MDTDEPNSKYPSEADARLEQYRAVLALFFHEDDLRWKKVHAQLFTNGIMLAGLAALIKAKEHDHSIMLVGIFALVLNSLLWLSLIRSEQYLCCQEEQLVAKDKALFRPGVEAEPAFQKPPTKWRAQPESRLALNLIQLVWLLLWGLVATGLFF